IFVQPFYGRFQKFDYWDAGQGARSTGGHRNALQCMRIPSTAQRRHAPKNGIYGIFHVGVSWSRRTSFGENHEIRRF
ncbi:MAG: hypothetical protein Q8L91_18410, partial [Polaromonas sp.]|nr:hypothetical protein [Polaromonas sp.]